MSTVAASNGALLALDDVTTYYAQMRILERINLRVGGGELVCLLGAILIVMMNARPQGILGSRRVEVV